VQPLYQCRVTDRVEGYGEIEANKQFVEPASLSIPPNAFVAENVSVETKLAF